MTWTLSGRGWVDCATADEHSSVAVPASFITAAPQELLGAITRLILQTGESRVLFEAEPDGYRWIFDRDGQAVQVRLLHLPGHDRREVRALLFGAAVKTSAGWPRRSSAHSMMWQGNTMTAPARRA